MKKILIVLIGLVMVTGCGCSKKEISKEEQTIRGEKNTNKGVIEDKVYDGLTFTNTSLTTIEGKTTLITLVENKTNSDYNLEYFDILMKDKDGNIIETLLGYLGDTIKKGETKRIKSSTDKDVSSVVKIEYEVKK